MFKIVVRACNAGSERYFSRMDFISSGPGAFEFFKRLMKDRPSSEDVWLDRSSSGYSRSLALLGKFFRRNFG